MDALGQLEATRLDSVRYFVFQKRSAVINFCKGR